MPVYKVDGVKKDGLQKYNVRVNYISDRGEAKQLTRTAYGLESGKGFGTEVYGGTRGKQVVRQKRK